MKNRVFNTILSVNSVFQAISCLAAPIALGALISWALTSNNITGPWIYAVLITVGALVGLISMVGFLLKVAETEKAMKKAAEEAERAEEEAGNEAAEEEKKKDVR
ncbi:MAG: hypothetical protein IJS71_04260 [Clostridia bacterium]|nr:hypothetical protein [Clostridia bacterium]